ncbi:MAG: heme exporter protein CcmD [Burkholderiales bacterium]|nr:heme exporter protein CcmD [Burkholderiales bacterium]
MNWGSFSAFLHMGGYAFYVWSSFGLSFALLAFELVQLSLRKRTLLKRLGQIQKLNEHRGNK